MPDGIKPFLWIEHSPLLIDQVNLVSHIAVGRTRKWDSIKTDRSQRAWTVVKRIMGRFERSSFSLFFSPPFAPLFSTQLNTLQLTLYWGHSRMFHELIPSTSHSTSYTSHSSVFPALSIGHVHRHSVNRDVVTDNHVMIFSLPWLIWAGARLRVVYCCEGRGGSFICHCTHNLWNFFQWSRNII